MTVWSHFEAHCGGILILNYLYVYILLYPEERWVHMRSAASQLHVSMEEGV